MFANSPEVWKVRSERVRADMERLKFEDLCRKRDVLRQKNELTKLDYQIGTENFRSKHWDLEGARASAEISHEQARMTRDDLYAIRSERAIRSEVHSLKGELMAVEVRELRQRIQEKNAIEVLQNSDVYGLLEGY